MPLMMLNKAMDSGTIAEENVLELLALRNPPPEWAEESIREKVTDEIDIDVYPIWVDDPHGCDFVSAWISIPKPVSIEQD